MQASGGTGIPSDMRGAFIMRQSCSRTWTGLRNGGSNPLETAPPVACSYPSMCNIRRQTTISNDGLPDKLVWWTRYAYPPYPQPIVHPAQACIRSDSALVNPGTIPTTLQISLRNWTCVGTARRPNCRCAACNWISTSGRGIRTGKVRITPGNSPGHYAPARARIAFCAIRTTLAVRPAQGRSAGFSGWVGLQAGMPD